MILYAGYPLSLPHEASEEVNYWLRYHAPPTWTNLFGYRTASGPRSDFLTLDKWQMPEPIMLGRLAWPVGCSRWATGHFLTSQEVALGIRTLCYGEDGDDPEINPQTLTISCHDTQGVRVGDKIERQMYLLPPRPLSWTGGGRSNNLYLLTLVDERYFWQWKHCGNLASASVATWEDLIDELVDQLGLNSGEADYSTIESEYLKPHASLQNAHSLNAAMMMDAVLYNVGRRAVWEHTPTNGKMLRILTADESSDRLQTKLATLANNKVPTTGGGVFDFGYPRFHADAVRSRAAITPRYVRVTFPVCLAAEDCATVGDSRYTVDTEIEPNGIGYVVFHDTALAEGTGTPSNSAELTDLAEQIAADWRDHQQFANLDVVFSQPLDWASEGFHDLWYLYDTDKSVRTRVFRPPWNLAPEELLHKESATGDCGDEAGVRTECLFECVEGVPMINEGLLTIVGGQLVFQPD